MTASSLIDDHATALAAARVGLERAAVPGAHPAVPIALALVRTAETSLDDLQLAIRELVTRHAPEEIEA